MRWIREFANLVQDNSSEPLLPAHESPFAWAFRVCSLLDAGDPDCRPTIQINPEACMPALLQEASCSCPGPPWRRFSILPTTSPLLIFWARGVLPTPLSSTRY